MAMKRALQAILLIGTGGLVFSGVLTYRELFAAERVAACPSVGAPGTVFGYPACVYGFFMYLAVVALAVTGLALDKRRARRAPAPPAVADAPAGWFSGDRIL